LNGSGAGSLSSTHSYASRRTKRSLPRRERTTRSRGNSKGALYGVPLAHKDMYYIKGKLSECGSKVRKGWIAPATSTALTRLAAAGSFRIGALHMSEFAYSPTGHNSYPRALRSLA
jgi:aspartyl-tRNA(Asn)/glutamyl-tRNA(Gln) amidotransferase subunit A